jgi:chromosome segregation ATPase
MTDQDRSDLLARRLQHVGAISALNAEALRLTQALAGTEMDMLRIELDMRKSTATEQLVRDLHEAQEKAGALQAAQAECDQRIASVEQEIEVIDRSLAALTTG